MWLLLVLQLYSGWTHAGSRNSNVILTGNWQSCKEDDGTYGERIWDYVYQGTWRFEFHMGPYHDFALYRVAQDDEHDHANELNKLVPHQVVVQGNRANQTWNLKDVRINVALGGGAVERCESWFVTIERKQ
jgi:hypothetical protein